MNRSRIDVVKVFSATKGREREDLGDRIALWLRTNGELTVLQTTVVQSSDSQFHCLSVVLICSRRGA